MLTIPAAPHTSSDENADEHPERRGPARKRVMIPAIALCPGGGEYRCVIRDVSMTGAKIGIGRDHRLPAHFRLVTGARPDGFPVRLVWQRRDYAGLALDVPVAD